MNRLISHNGMQYVDQHGRMADQCREQAVTAKSYAAALRLMCETTEGSLTFGREGGPRVLRRLDRTASIDERLAARDAELAEQIEAADAWLAEVIEHDQIGMLAAVRVKHNIPADAIEIILERYRLEFEEALDRIAFAAAQRERAVSEDRGRVMAIINRAEREAEASGGSAAVVAWSMIVASQDPRSIVSERGER